MSDDKTWTLAKAIADYFAIPASEMVANFKALTVKDKADLREMLRGEGYNILDPA